MRELLRHTAGGATAPGHKEIERDGRARRHCAKQWQHDGAYGRQNKLAHAGAPPRTRLCVSITCLSAPGDQVFVRSTLKASGESEKNERRRGLAGPDAGKPNRL